MTSGHNSSPSSVRGSSGSARLGDRKSTRLNSSHSQISYAVFCLKKKKLLPDVVSAAKSGRLPSADAEDRRLGRTLRDFRLLVRHSLTAARCTRRPLSAARLNIDLADLTTKVGPRGIAPVCELVRDVAAQNLREHDIVAALPDAVLVCMPETDEAAA